jgi:DNA-binding response OmpR family regulator
MRILLVDDEEEFVSALAERLSLRGIEAHWTTSAEAALAKVEIACYELAVLDIKMPRIGGIKLKKILQAKCPDMKFIFLTGHGSEDDFKLGTADVGADCYLVKPIQIDTLLTRMQEVLEK